MSQPAAADSPPATATTGLEALRAAIPLLNTRAYLFSGGIAPLATPVREALDSWMAQWSADPLAHRADYHSAWRGLRESFSALVGTGPEDVAVTENTSRATNLAVRLLGLPPGSNVLVDDTTYPTMAWAFLAEDGVRVRRVDPAPGQALTDAFAAAADARTACVAVSHVSALDGRRHDLPALASFAADRGARLLVDAAQSTGVVPVDMVGDGVDALVTTAMKWLLGPPGVGFLAMRPDVAAAGPLGDVGYVSAHISDAYELTALPDFPTGARRAEVGLAPLPLLPAAAAGIRLVQEAGVARIGARVESLVTRVLQGLASRGFATLTPDDPAQRAGVVAFRADAAEHLAAALRRRGVDVWGYPSGRVRVDPHGFNNGDDIERLLEGIDAWRRDGSL